MSQINWVRVGFIFDGVLFLVLALGFILPITYISDLWPWSASPLAYIFLAALLISYGSGSLLIAYLQDWSAALAGTLALIVAFAGFGIHALIQLASGSSPGNNLMLPALILLAIAGLAAGTLRTARETPPKDSRPIPGPIRVLLSLFAPVLLASGAAILFQIPAVLPWQLSAETSMLLGWILMGLSINYGYVGVCGTWSAARVLLFGFLFYCLAVIIPFVEHFYAVDDTHFISLAVNTGVAVVGPIFAVAVLGAMVQRD